MFSFEIYNADLLSCLKNINRVGKPKDDTEIWKIKVMSKVKIDGSSNNVSVLAPAASFLTAVRKGVYYCNCPGSRLSAKARETGGV